jgi:hypothetical protein
VSALRQLLAWSELRFAARRLRRAPSFAGAVVLVLAFGVGTTTAVFSLVNSILLEPLPYPEPGRLGLRPPSRVLAIAVTVWT